MICILQHHDRIGWQIGGETLFVPIFRVGSIGYQPGFIQKSNRTLRIGIKLTNRIDFIPRELQSDAVFACIEEYIEAPPTDSKLSLLIHNPDGCITLLRQTV